MKPRVVFVDDEAAVLDGLRDRLRRHRHAWDMVFHVSALGALDDLRAHGGDVVVSDVRMPEMSGAELLGHVRELCPAATRIALSGQTDADTAMRLFVTAHQFLSKPCDVTQLIELIERRQRLGEMVPLRAIELVASAPEVPAAPATYRALLAVFGQATWSLDDVRAVVEQDAVAATHLVRIGSSSYFGGRRVSSVSDAVRILGAKTVQQIVLGLHAAGAFSGRDARSVRAYTQHAQTIADAAASLALPADVGDAYVAGLLHDVGALVLEATPSTRYPELLREAQERAVPVEVVERERLGFDHAHAGAALLAIWGMPCTVVEAVLLHHAEDACGGALAQNLREATRSPETAETSASKYVDKQRLEILS